MKYYLALWTILIALTSMSWGAADEIQPLTPLDTLPAGTVVSEYIQRIHDRYNELRTKLNNNRPFQEVINAIISFRSAFSYQYDISSLNETTEIILKDIFNKIYRYLDENNKKKERMPAFIFERIISLIEELYRVNNITSCVLAKKAWIGQNVLSPPEATKQNFFSSLLGISDQKKILFTRTIKETVGRIFVVANNRIISTASGIAIPSIKNGLKVYDKILTCTHSMQPDQTYYGFDFYFVSNAYLDETTGLPDLVNINGTRENRKITEYDLVQYLEGESSVIFKNAQKMKVGKIDSFQLCSCRNASIIKIKDFAPRYKEHEDIGIGHLRSPLALSEDLANISVLNQETYDQSTNHSETLPFTYYAVGFPDLSHLNIRNQGQLIEGIPASPLVITSSRNNEYFNHSTELILKLNSDKTWRVGCPATRGVSGGPVLRMNPETNTIEIMGVMSSCTMSENFMCGFSKIAIDILASQEETRKPPRKTNSNCDCIVS